MNSKIAYITGTSSGIGHALALQLVVANYFVVGLDIKNQM